MKYSQERKPSAFGELSRAAELRPKQAVWARLAPPHQRTVKDVAAEKGYFPRDPLPLASAGTPHEPALREVAGACSRMWRRSRGLRGTGQVHHGDGNRATQRVSLPCAQSQRTGSVSCRAQQAGAGDMLLDSHRCGES